MKTIIGIEGMTCAHCVAAVGKALKNAGAQGIRVDRWKKQAEIEAGSAPEQAIRDAVAEAGYEVTGFSETKSGFSLFRS